MMTRFKTALVLAAIAIASLPAAHAEDAADKPGRTIVAQARPITAAVTAVQLDGALDLVLAHGAAPALTVRAEQRLQPNIVTTVDGSTLKISMRGLVVNPRTPLQVELTLPALRSLALNSSGDVRAQGFRGEVIDVLLNGSGDLDFRGQYRQLNASLKGSGDLAVDNAGADAVSLNLFGSGDVRASGSVKALSVQAVGSGDVNASGMKAERVSLMLLGSGDVRVHASAALDANLIGSGSVHVGGKPAQRAVRRVGSGEISWD